ncbi:MAG: transferase [Thermodesulfobacteriota bacterium]|nr:transferase [Thermodesulfobacteriota bacterium]
MKNLKQLNDRIISRVNINLKEFNFDTGAFVENSLDYKKMMKFFAFYGITSHHPIFFHFKDSNIAGSYFLGKCYVKRSAVYKTDVRGDELKRKGDDINCPKEIPLQEDEFISIKDSLLYKTLVHNYSHNPESPEEFSIRNTISTHYVNIHGATVEGCFLGPFATVDLMALHSCIVGEFSYIQTGEFFHKKIAPGTVWIKNADFEFKYKFKKKILDNYVGVTPSHQPRGLIYDFVQQRENEYEKLFEIVNPKSFKAPATSAVSRFAVTKGNTLIGENVLVAQRAFLDNAEMGGGSNAQENSYIINSKLAGLNITAHGGKIINADMGLKVFVGFNAFLNGKENARLKVGNNCIIMPHTIIDNDIPLDIADNHLVWGFIKNKKDLKTNTIHIDKLSEIKDTLNIGELTFKGSGAIFIDAFTSRIEHILQANGAYCDDHTTNRGHAQDDRQIAFNLIQPYRTGKNKGIYPEIRIKP